VRTSTGAPKGKSNEAAHITGQSTPLSVLLLFVTEIISLLVVETNRCYQEYFHSKDIYSILRHTEQCLFPFPQSAVYFANLYPAWF